MKLYLRIFAATLLGVLFGGVLYGATYTMFSPGGALSGTWNSQNVALDSGAFITGTLPVVRGGTNLVAAGDDNSIVGNGTTWESKAIPNCGSSTQALSYSTASNAYACQTIAGTGIGQSTASGTLTYANACTVDGLQNYTYVLTGSEVTLTFTSQFACTSDSTAMISDALPLAIRPARLTAFANLTAQDASGVVSACFQIATTGVITWFKMATSPPQCASGAWTGSGTKGPLTLIGTSPFISNGGTFTYTIL